MDLNRLSAKEIEKLLRVYLERSQERIKVYETQDYYIIEHYVSTRYSMKRIFFYSIVNMLSKIFFGKYLRFRFKIKNILVINKYYGSIDASCVLGSKKGKGIRLDCIGRPKPIEYLLDVYKPDTLVLNYPPRNIQHCKDKEILVYPLTFKTDKYVCKVK